MAGKTGRFFETKNFGLVIGLLIFALLLLVSSQTVLIKNLELSVLDFNFRLKTLTRGTRVEEGVTAQRDNPKISPDILIVGIDDKSLDTFGRWPFPRYTEANLVRAFTRIKEQAARERALFLDLAFIEPSIPEHDVLLIESIRENGRVFLEPFLTRAPNPAGTEEEYFARQEILYERYGKITTVQGDWTRIETLYGLLPPLKPYARAARGYGHPVFVEDDDQVYRRAQLLVKLARLLEEIPVDELGPQTLTEQERRQFTRLNWVDKNGMPHDVAFPLTAGVIEDLKKTMAKRAPLKGVDTNNDGQSDLYYHVVRKYRDSLVPAITLSLALEYFHKGLEDIEVVLGEYIRIPSPEVFNPQTQGWEPYRLLLAPQHSDEAGNVLKPARLRAVNEIRIPINDRGQMLVNFMGEPSTASREGHQTFPVRSFAVYASRSIDPDPERWPAKMGADNKVVMVGMFAKGAAEDEKTTPFGLMYGVEIHATALNTILMDNFLHEAAPWVNALILLALVLLTAFMASRLPTIWSLVLSLLLIVLYFLAATLIFDIYNRIIVLSAPVFGVLFSFLAVIVYRIMTEEKDKRRIRDMFGRYVSPGVVDQILANPPELGGVDKELTVLFSDIRGFTTLSESMTPQELVNHLNVYFTAMTDVLMQYQGTLDKYIGDMIMGFWGAPLPQPDHAMLACKCALRWMEVLEQLNSGWPPEGRIDIGIGINSGIMTVGNIGSVGRMNYTLMGDEVNLGSRLESLNKPVPAGYGTHVIISESTRALVSDRVVARELDDVRVKGRNKPVTIYELVDVLDGLEPPAPVARAK